MFGLLNVKLAEVNLENRERKKKIFSIPILTHFRVSSKRPTFFVVEGIFVIFPLVGNKGEKSINGTDAIMLCAVTIRLIWP